MNNNEENIWSEKYRPKNIDEFVGADSIKEKMREYIAQQDIPHLLFYGPPGGGKTTLRHILLNSIECDALVINASEENGIDTVRDKIKTFASTIGFAPFKVIVLEEMDYLTPNAQAALRNVTEQYSASTRFIFSCNYIERLMPAMFSRMQDFRIEPLSKPEAAKCLARILKAEKVQFTKEDIANVVTVYHPDLRKIINAAQKLTSNGILKIEKNALVELDYMEKILTLITKSKSVSDSIKLIRQIVADNQIRDFTHIYRYIYDRALTGPNATAIILLTAEAQYQDTFVIDKEINFMAYIIKLLKEI